MSIPETDDIVAKINELSEKEMFNNQSLYDDLMKKYNQTLSLKFEQLTFTDDYGDSNFESWIIERDNFIVNKLSEFIISLSNEVNSKLKIHFSKSVSEKMYELCLDVIIATLKEKIRNKIDYFVENNKQTIYNEEINLSDPIEFEKSIEYLFNSFGWNARQTKSTGDQGADVIAKKGDFISIIQCKLYSQPVGNKAVQEVFSAKKYYNGNDGVVITNSSYTKSAKMLASSTNIKLLHYSEIENYINSIE
jgi:restriction system protein